MLVGIPNCIATGLGLGEMNTVSGAEYWLMATGVPSKPKT
jgi:hypothetical protein